MRKTIATAALLLALAGLAGCADTATVDPGTAPPAGATTGGKAGGNAVAVGKGIPVRAANGSKATVTVLKTTSRKTGKGEFAQGPANGQFVIADVQVKVTDGSFPVNPLYVRYQAADGRTYDIAAGNSATSGYEPALDSGDLPAGQSVRGVVVFDVPAGKGKQIQLTDEMGTLIGVWEL